jgi:paraquat-inducible protein A
MTCLTAMIECPLCGLVQRLPEAADAAVISCRRCKSQLERRTGKNLDVAFACSAATLLLMVPAIFAPLLTTAAFGVTRTSVLPSSAFDLWDEGWPLLCIAVLLFVVVLPLARFALLTAVLGALRFGRRAPWAGPAFRIADRLESWAMLDVFLLGLAVAYARLHATISVTLRVGGLCFIAAALLSLFVRAALDRRRVWRRIAPDAAADASRHCVGCNACGLAAPSAAAGRRCTRCGAILKPRRAQSLSRACALLAASLLLYFPANLYPMATLPINLTPTAYTVLGGIVDLAKSHLVGLALLVFAASFAVPLLKMAGLAWCAASVLRRSRRRLVAKTRVFRVLQEIGRWSMVDPFTIGCVVPVVHFNNFIDGRAEAAATPFAAMVILTTLAVKLFDPRLLWDAAAR